MCVCGGVGGGGGGVSESKTLADGTGICQNIMNGITDM